LKELPLKTKVYAEPIFVHFISLGFKIKKVFRLIVEFSVWPVVVSFHKPSPQPLMGCWVLFEFNYEFMKVFVILEPFLYWEGGVFCIILILEF
jgi:hypothetical protein